MATVSSTAVASNTYPKFLETGEFSLKVTHTFTASSGDVVQMLKVPSGFQVTDVAMVASIGASTSAGDAVSGVITVGDGNTAARYITGSMSATALTRLNTISGMGYIYTAADTIDVTVASLTGTGSASPTVKVTLLVWGCIDSMPV